MCADAEAWMCEWGSLLLHQSSPPAFLAPRGPIGASGGCHRRSIFISIVPSSASAASLHTWKPPFLPSSSAVEQNSPLQPPWITRDSSSGVTFWADLPSSSSAPASLGLPLQLSPSPIFFPILCSLKCSGKSRQAVSSCCKSVCWLGSWSSTVPLEDDPVDEDRRDGPGGAAGETEDSHPNHRWVRAIYIILSICFCMWLQRILQAEWYLVVQHGFSSWFASNIGNVSCKQVYLGFFSTPPSQSDMQSHDGCNGRWLESDLCCTHWLPSDFTPSTHFDLDWLFCAGGTSHTSFLYSNSIFRRKRYFKICGYSRLPFWCNLVWCVAKVPMLQIPFISTDRNQVKSIYRAQIRTLLRQKHPTKISS